MYVLIIITMIHLLLVISFNFQQFHGFYQHRNALGYKIVGNPILIEDQRYQRNAFYFNLCFVCDSWARTVQYEPIVKKLSEYFVSSVYFQSNSL